MQNISLLFGENNYKSLDQRKCLKNKTLPDTGWINKEDKITMAAVLIGPKEVLVIVIVTAVVVFVVMVRRKRKR